MTSDRERRRRSRFTLRLTADERHKLVSGAARAGLCPSAFARALLLGAKPPRAARRPSVDTVLLTDALARLGMIATSLHQIADRLSVTPQLPFVMRELLHALAGLASARLVLLRALGRRAA